ncbi:MAG: Maf family protein [Mariprofundus sp.]|nr:Maf family protein [Mariprofundus sp.]
MEIILASRSPRRRLLLQSAGLAVEVCPSHIDESPLPSESVQQMVERLCQAKAMACDAPADIPVIAADTLVSIHGQALGQPTDLQHAKSMLQQLSGQEHEVFTGVCVRLNQHILFQQVRTGVRFRSLDESEIDTYLLHNDVLDKAGAYAIQAGAASFIESIDGPLDNVIGLPIRTTLHMIADIKNIPA